VGEEAGEANTKRGGPKPEVKPEGSRVTLSNNDLGDGAEGIKPSENILPNGSVKIVVISKISGCPPILHPAKPASPRSGGIRVELGKEFSKKRSVLGRDR
jgi:hypothetical protein